MRQHHKICLLVVALLCFSTFAGAYSTEKQPLTVGNLDGHEVTMILPEGYTVTSLEDAGNVVSISNADTGTPDYKLSFAFSEEYSGVSSFDMKEDEFLQLSEILQAEYNMPSVTYAQTQEGSRLIILDENKSGSDFANIYTLYKGYFVQVYIARPDYATLSDKDIDVGIQLINDTHILGL